MRSLHTHSEYSARDGFGKISELADRVSEIQMGGLALTDHGTVAGFPEFLKVFRERGLQAIPGMEAYHAEVTRAKPTENKRDQAHLVLLAKNKTGYENLLRLSDEANRTGFHYVPRVDWELLERYSEGIIATSACLSGLVSKGIENDDRKALNRYMEIFKDDFYIELHTYEHEKQVKVNEALVSIATERGVPMVVATDAHYPSPDDWQIHEVMIAMKDNREYDPDNPWHPQSLYLMTEREIHEKLEYLGRQVVDEACYMTEVIASDCLRIDPEKSMHIPKWKAEKSADEILIDLIEEGLKEKYEFFTGEELERAEYELEAIIDAGLSDYFLITRDIVFWARKQGILVGPGRGSVGGSILAYVLDITDVDPLKYGLIFERFWNPGRSKGFPDIDLDFEDDRRDEVKEYIIQKYGERRVLSIGTVGKAGPKQALNDVARTVFKGEIPYNETEKIKGIINRTVDAGLASDWPEIWEQEGTALEPYRKQYPELFALTEVLTDRIRQYGTHPSGVIISPIDLPGHIPCRMDRKENQLLTQYDMRDVEGLGFLKVDVLGLRTMTTLKKYAELIGEPDFDWREIHRNAHEIPPEVWEQVDNGLTLGFFQIEATRGAKDIAKRLKPRSIADLGLCVALNRPGALRKQKHEKTNPCERYLRCREGRAAPKLIHELIDPILVETYGEIIYQEQILAILVAFGYTLADADAVRKIMGKKKREDMVKLEPEFMKKAQVYLSEDDAFDLFNKMSFFALYGFNKSHAIGYGMILLWSMYAKWADNAKMVMAGIMTAQDKDRIGAWIREGQKLGVRVSPPDINKSESTIKMDGETIYYGLGDVKGVGKGAAQWVINHRPYTCVQDLRDAVDNEWAEWEAGGKVGLSPRQILKSNAIDALYNAGAFDSVEPRDIDDNDRVEYEEELLGINITDPTLKVIKENKRAIDKLATPFEYQESEEKEMAVVAVVQKVKETKIRADARRNAGKTMAFIDAEWDGQEFSITAFADEYKACKYMLTPRSVCKFVVKRGDQGPTLVKGMKFV